MGNASAHFSQIRRTKILKQLNPEVQSLAKDMDFSQSAPYLFGQGIEQKIKEHVDAVHMLKRTTTTEFKSRSFFKGASLKQAGLGEADIRHKPAINPTIKATMQRSFGPSYVCMQGSYSYLTIKSMHRPQSDKDVDLIWLGRTRITP